jgi:NADPH:quinone reductase-like Zn-dependent oxidoreductase
VSGIVTAVGPSCEWAKVGDRVRAGFIYGGFKEEVAANEYQSYKISPQLGFQTAFLGNYITSYYSLKVRGNIKEGETVLVLGGSGGIGLTSIELAKAFGCTVIAAAGSEAKLQACKAAGADFLVNYEEPGWHKKVKDFSGGEGRDLIVDPVGDKFTEPAVRTLAWGGRLLIIGFAAGEIPKIPMNLLLLKVLCSKHFSAFSLCCVKHATPRLLSIF